MDIIPLFLIALSMGIAIGLHFTKRRFVARVTRNLGQFLASRGGRLTDSEGRGVSYEELVSQCLREEPAQRSPRVFLMYLASFGVGTVIALVASFLMLR